VKRATVDEKEELNQTLDSDGWNQVLRITADYVRTRRQRILTLAISGTETLTEEVKAIIAVKQLLRQIYQASDVAIPDKVEAMFS